MRPLRVLIASDGIAGLTSAEASEVIGRAFVAHDAQVAVIPMAVQGQQLNQAILRIHPDAEVVSCSGPADVLQHLGAPRTRPVFLDLSGMAEMDVDEVLGWVSPTQLRAFAELPHGAPLVAVVGEADASQPLTGMPGIIAERGRLRGLDLAETIAANDRASAWLEQAGLDPETTTGAASGVGALVAAAGGAVRDGVTACAEAARFDQVASRADVVVTGAEQLDFHAVGGPVVREVVSRAGQVLRPVIVVAGRCFVSPRELRIAGVETAYPILDGPGDEPATHEQLEATAARVAATWRFI